MGPVGWQEMAVIGILALVLFGPKRLPELARNLGKALAEFRRAKEELKSTFDVHMKELERETHSLRETTSQFSNEISSSYYNSYEDNSYYDSGVHDTNHSEPTPTPALSEPSPVSVSAPQDAEPTHLAAHTAHSSEPVLDNGHHAAAPAPAVHQEPKA